MGIQISANPEYNEHPGIDASQQFRKLTHKYVVTSINPDTGKEKIRFHTDHEFDLLVETNKTIENGAPPVIVRVEDFEKNKKRDGMRVIKRLPIKNLHESNWVPKVQFVVPDAYKEERKPNGSGRPLKEK